MIRNQPPRSKIRMAKWVADLSSSERKIAEHAEACLIRHYGGRSTELLIQACLDASPAVRFRAVWILGKSKDVRAFDSIVVLLEDPDPSVQYDAAYALGELGDPRGFEILRKVIESKPEPTDLTYGAMQGLGVSEDAFGIQSPLSRRDR